jgi:hypothetical protein
MGKALLIKLFNMHELHGLEQGFQKKAADAEVVLAGAPTGRLRKGVKRKGSGHRAKWHGFS